MGVWTFLPAAFFGLAAGRSLWSSRPASYGDRSTDDYILKSAYPLGNGKLGAMPFGAPELEKLLLNVDSLWSGGPFENASYSGGNPLGSQPKYPALPGIRSKIFDQGTGDVSGLLGSNDNYGSYQVLGNLTVDFDGFADYYEYRRSLDLATGVHTTVYDSDGLHVETSSFCSFPDQVCVWTTSSNGTLPPLNVHLQNLQVSQDLVNTTCANDNHVRLEGVTQLGPPEGLQYGAVARLSKDSHAKASCHNGQLKVVPSEGKGRVTVIVGAGTNFDQTKGTAGDNYSFRGAAPGSLVTETTSHAAYKNTKTLLDRHIRDFSTLTHKFKLNLPDTLGSKERETTEIISELQATGPSDPFLDGLLFDYSRYLLISSSRENSLPANLQGRWNEDIKPSWSSDYHANINLQMNYWPADQTGLTETQGALWDYMRYNWVPRGTETARLLYNASGWVTHNEMNIFGHTAMKDGATWANYPLAGAWMMQHVWDYFDYTRDIAWYKEIGYPLLKGIAEFWLSQLQEDEFSNDETLVVNSCNSPEQGPTTFGCAHDQQEIHQVFDNILASAGVVDERDRDFLSQVSSAISKLDKGLHLTDWGGIKEWKLPDSYGYDTKNTHRHLSHLTGWYPGYSVSSYLDGYVNETIQSAIRETLIARGSGNGNDANSGWAKVWRAAAWARLNNTEKAYYHLKYAIQVNFVGNGLSMYGAAEPPFQIDANLGFGGAVLSMLSVDLPLAHDSDETAVRTVVLGPAIPSAWAGGSVNGLRIRGGGIVDFEWDDSGLVTTAHLTDSKSRVKVVNKEGTILAEHKSTTVSRSDHLIRRHHSVFGESTGVLDSAPMDKVLTE